MTFTGELGAAVPPYRGTGKITIDNPLEFTYTGQILKSGSSSSPTVCTTADTKQLQFYLENSATSGDNRGMYLRLYLSGAGGGGEAARIFTTCDNVACGTAHGAYSGRDVPAHARSSTADPDHCCSPHPRCTADPL